MTPCARCHCAEWNHPNGGPCQSCGNCPGYRVPPLPSVSPQPNINVTIHTTVNGTPYPDAGKLVGMLVMECHAYQCRWLADQLRQARR